MESGTLAFSGGGLCSKSQLVVRPGTALVLSALALRRGSLSQLHLVLLPRGDVLVFLSQLLECISLIPCLSFLSGSLQSGH